MRKRKKLEVVKIYLLAIFLGMAQFSQSWMKGWSFSFVVY